MDESRRSRGWFRAIQRDPTHVWAVRRREYYEAQRKFPLVAGQTPEEQEHLWLAMSEINTEQYFQLREERIQQDLDRLVREDLELEAVSFLADMPPGTRLSLFQDFQADTQVRLPVIASKTSVDFYEWLHRWHY